MAGNNVLFISYDGMTDPLGQSQVLPYLRGLARRGHDITLLSAEKPLRYGADAADISRICAAAGIRWHSLRYHKRPPLLSTVYDLGALERRAVELHRERHFEIIHCRSYIPAFVGARMKRHFGTSFLFDMRGFWPEEKVEGGSWPLRNPLFAAVYRYFKVRERAFLSEADHVVTLTRAAREEIASRADVVVSPSAVSVIPCCVDFGHFPAPSGELRLRGREALGIDAARPVLGYVGSLGGNYMLPEMLRFFAAYRARRPGALFLFITRNPPEEIRSVALMIGIAAEALMIRSASRQEVPVFTAAVDHGVAFKQPSFSAKGCSPTKLGEMLALGIPVAANSCVGDVEEVVHDTRGGVIVERFDDRTLAAGVEALLALRTSPDEIRAAAKRWFELEEGTAKYHSIYRQLTTEPMQKEGGQ